MRKSLLGVTVAALVLSIPQPLVAQDDVDQQLGNVHFKTSCNDVAQRRFDRGMRYQHSFWYTNAKEVFEEAAKADPTCAMAYWGIALTLMDNPHGAIPRPNLAPGLAAITKAKEMGAKTERERDYIDALMVMYTDYDNIPHVQRMRALRDKQAQVAAKYPDDDEAQIAYAITLNTSADLNDKTYAQQTKGAAILEPMSIRLPQHPGVTHYLIHLYDYPATAQKGLEAANRYAKIAPAAPHAQHMPSHIYTRVGYWKESIASNAASVKAAKAEKSVGNYLHAQDYMVYAHLQLAQDQLRKTAGASGRPGMILRLAQTEVPRAEMSAASSAPAFADTEPPLWDGLGSITYKITTKNERAQAYFNQGLRLAYAFNHGEAQRAFRKAQKLDPDCAMCFWGEALVLGPNINLPMQEDAIAPAYAAAQKAIALAGKATPREQALISALAVRYSNDAKAERAPLDTAYAAEMAKAAAQFPNDNEIATLYAEA